MEPYATGAVTVGEPREVAFRVKPCVCVKNHSPKVNHTVEHHIHPMGWGGPDVKTNTVFLCPTAHSEVHRMLDAFVRARAVVPRRREWGEYAYALAVEGWKRAGR